ncbi:MAG: hypothetical protein HC771_04675 [Synechococcales cyanobacterium CRU_2_2]|nr:hypothetical protein [Synechococcales cyanobacterium CRU_2_2]
MLQQPDDPESLVYLNNARSRLKADPNPLRIAVSLPVGKPRSPPKCCAALPKPKTRPANSASMVFR